MFKNITLTYNDEEYVVKAESIMRLIAVIEDCISLQELTRDNGAPLGKLSRAYAAALRFAGCRVTDEQVYAGLFGTSGGSNAGEAVTGLLMLMIPPSSYQPDQKKSPQKKAAARRKG